MKGLVNAQKARLKTSELIGPGMTRVFTALNLVGSRVRDKSCIGVGELLMVNIRGKQPRKVLWTGGFDSTFRICYLLLVEQNDVQPMYVIDVTRDSTSLELETMSKIRDALRERASATLLPTRIFNRDDYVIPPELKAMHERIREQASFGIQYLWLAAVAEAEGWRDVEMGNHRHPAGTPEWQKVVFEDPPRSSKLSERPEAQLFKYFSAPILHLSKPEMMELATKYGFVDILMMRWFCHHPIGKRACGHCGPCRIARRDGVTGNANFAPMPLRATAFLKRAVRHFRNRSRPANMTPVR